jgi:hypothetical protein
MEEAMFNHKIAVNTDLPIKKICCCEVGHKITYPTITNLQFYSKGFISYYNLSVPKMETEGVCNECKAVIKDSIEIDPRAMAVVSHLMTTISSLKNEMVNLQLTLEGTSKELEALKASKRKKKKNAT